MFCPITKGFNGEARRVPAIAKFCRTTTSAWTDSTDPDGQLRLRGQWRDLHVLKRGVGATETHRSLTPRLAHQTETLIADFSPCRKGRAQGRKFFGHPAPANTDNQSSPRELVNRRQHLCQDHRVAIRQNQYTGAEGDSWDHSGDVAEERHRFQHIVPVNQIHRAGDDNMISDPDRIKPYRLGVADIVQDGWDVNRFAVVWNTNAKFHAGSLLEPS